MTRFGVGLLVVTMVWLSAPSVLGMGGRRSARGGELLDRDRGRG